MLHSVPPPTLPPILEPVQSANSIVSASELQFPAIAQADVLENQEKSQSKRETAPILNTGSAENYRLPISNDITKYNSVAATIAAPNKPETLPPEFSPLAVSRSAVNLGQPQAVGYPKQQVKEFNFHNATGLDSPVVPSVTNNKNSLPPKQQVLAEKSTQQIQLVETPATDPSQESKLSISAFEPAADAPSSQPVQNILEFKSRNPTNETATPSTIEFQSPTQQTQPPTGTPQQPAPTTTPPARERIVEVTSDRQEYDEQRRIVTAEGNVVVRFDGAVVDADRLQVNLDNLIAVGEGNVALTRGDQVLRGQRFTYNFVQDSGELANGSGEIYIPSASTDFAFNSTDITAGGVPQRPLSDRIRANQPAAGVSSPGGIDLVLGGGPDARNVPPPKTGGVVRRVRFEAKRIDFYPRGWQAEDVRLTNDPFSPPELELRADKVTVTREAPLIDRIRTQRQRLVFDQKFSLPIPIDQRTIDRREREVTPTIVSPGFDADRRGGLYVERSFTPFSTEQASLSITPQFFAQKAVQGEADNLAAMFGVKSRLNAVFGPRTALEGSGELTSLDLSEVEDNLRASLRLRQLLGEPNPHILNLEYSYRDRLYNGTLGFQTVQSSLGGVLLSPVIPLGDSGVNLTYQAGAQYINANTDRQDLLEPVRENDRISLGRLQASADLSKGFLLWQGKPLPPTATEGLRYTANPVVPYLQAVAGITGTTSYYTNGDNQSTLTGRIGLVGQIGNFSRPFLDYTAFNITYYQGFNSGLSPFLFDRSVDNRVLSAGISQQIYGPFRLGFQTSINLDTGEESSTDYILEYSRRTYGITLRYNPVLELGGFSIRISDFNWTGGTDPFSGGQIKPVVNGVEQQN